MLILTMIFSLVGCGKGDVNTPETTQDNTGESTEASDAAEEVTLTIVHHMGEEYKRKALQAWSDTVTEENPNYMFEITAISNPEEMQKLIQTKIAAVIRLILFWYNDSRVELLKEAIFRHRRC